MSDKAPSSQSGCCGDGYSGTGTQSDLNNHTNQCNPNNQNFQGHTSSYPGTGTKADLDNHANQCNPSHAEFKGGNK